MIGLPFQFFTLQLHKNYIKREVGVLKNLNSGTFKRFATQFSSLLQKSPQVTSYVTHNHRENSQL
jgi:hypothetical protein